MDSEVDLSNSTPEVLNDEAASEAEAEAENGTSGKTAPLGKIEAGMNGELGDESPSGFNPSNEAERQVEDAVGEARGSLSSVEAVVSSPVMPLIADGDLAGGQVSAKSPQNLVGSPPPLSMDDQAPGSSSTKGYGLKRWRRVRRNLNTDAPAEVDSALLHKRRLPIPESTKGRDERIRSDGEAEPEPQESAASVDLTVIVGSPVSITPSLPVALDPELRSLAESGFSVGAESENSEERSGKSSTAASIPRLRHETGFGRERSRIRNISGRGSGHVVHHKGQRTKGGTGATRKFREDRVRVEKENSYSSVESDMRSSHSAFMGWGSVVSNGKNVTSPGDEGDQSEEVRSGYRKENGELEDISRDDLDADSLKEENIKKNENCQSEAYLDPFLESIAALKAAQAALEDEIQKFGEIKKYAVLDDSDDDYEGTNPPALEARLIELNQLKEQLEFKLEEALASVEAKEAEVLKLEAVVNGIESSSRLSFLEGRCKELEVEVENLLEKRMEVEIEYLVMTRTTQSWKFTVEDHIALLEEQKVLAGNQTDMLAKLRVAEEKAMKLKLQADEINACCNALKRTQEVVRLQNSVCKYSLCSFVQMTILCITLGLFLMHVFPSSSDVVPT